MTENKFMSVSYELMIEQEGEPSVLVEKTSKDRPFEFVTGLAFTLPQFESQVKDLAKGDKFDFVIKQEDAYGPYDENRVKELPKDIFRGGDGHFDAETIYPGNIIPMVNEEGMRFDGLVKEVKDNTVVVDFNHELAGMDLHFRGEVMEAHAATPEEISGFVNRMSCHCGGDCGEGCDCGHDHEHGDCCGHDHNHGECGCHH